MRGKGIPALIDCLSWRITPAHAGKRPLKWCRQRDYSDHPRPCGEKVKVFRRECVLYGSPPPMRGKGEISLPVFIGHRITPPLRGKVRRAEDIEHLQRITPAHAGKSCFDTLKALDIADHPRPCGEKSLRRSQATFGRGSPPPMRGKGSRSRLNQRSQRITPRPCGEKPRSEPSKSTVIGSPPPMRGKDSGKPVSRRRARITPAHAGKRS